MPATGRRVAGIRGRRSLVLAALVLCALAPGRVGAAPALVYEANLAGNPPLGRAISITLEPATGELCVTDERARTINVFDAAGNHRYGTSATSQLSMPRDASIDSEAGFVFTDTEGRYRTIRRLNFLAEPLPFAPELPREDWFPRRLLLCRNGEIVTLDRRALLCRHDANGALLWKRQVMDRDEEGADLLGRPAEASDGSIYVTDGLGGVVLVYGPDGAPRTQFGEKGSRPGELSFPIAVSFAPDGRVLVLDQIKHRVVIFDAEHRFLREWGGVGFAPGAFYNPTDLTVAPDARVYVTQGFEGRVQVYRLADPEPR